MTDDDPGPTYLELVYISYSTVAFDEKALRALLRTSRENNISREISGALYYVAGSFFQVLEGPEDAVEALYEKIGKDPRHAGVMLLRRRFVRYRSFEHWAMGYVSNLESSDALVDHLAGYCDFLSSGQLAEGTAHAAAVRALLLKFREGRFRRSETPKAS